jgi:hypothetical protein
VYVFQTSKVQINGRLKQSFPAKSQGDLVAMATIDSSETKTTRAKLRNTFSKQSNHYEDGSFGVGCRVRVGGGS